MTEAPQLNKLPPQAIDLEVAVLGAILIESAYSKVADLLRSEMFYKPEHAKIYTAIIELSSGGDPVDILTVTQKLRAEGCLEQVGGALYISQLTSRVASSAHLEVHARIIVEQHIKREIINLSQQTLDIAYEDTTDLFDLYDLHNNRMNEIIQANVKADATHVKNLGREIVEEIAARNLENNFVSGVPTYINSADRILGGYAKTDLIYIAARPGMGKTAYIVSNALQQGQNGHSVAIFSLEMSKKQLMYRFISQITGIELETLMKRQLDADRTKEANRAVGILERLPIYIDDTPALSVYDFRAKTTRLKRKHNIEVAYVDYVQLMTLGMSMSKKMAGNREQEISQISRTLKQTAKECSIPVVALAQLSRAVETRGGDKRPMLSDLRESGSLEQDADVVGFLYRPEYYGFADDSNGNPTAGKGEMIVAKNRNGRCNTIPLRFVARTTTYCDDDAANYQSEPPHPDAFTTPKSPPPNESFLDKKAPF